MGEAQARSATSLVQVGAAFEHARQMGRFDAFAVVFGNKGWPVVIGGDADATGSMAGGVLDQIAHDFREVGPIETHRWQ